MAKYTEKQLQEFRKMGYFLDEMGNLTKEVKLQKIIRTNADTVTMKQVELKSFDLSTRTNSEDRAKVERYMGNTFTRVQDWFMDEERKARGLVTAKKPGVDYSLLPDGTKVCRCCQDRFTAEHFHATSARKDGLSSNCKKCDYTRTKSYNEEKAKAEAAKRKQK